MSNEYTYSVIDRLNSADWVSPNGLREPISWENDRTRLNADNLNTLTNSIKDIRGVVSIDNEILREAILYLASKWNKNGAYDLDLVVSKALSVVGKSEFNSDILAKGNVVLSDGKDIKLGDVSLSTTLSNVSTSILNLSNSVTDLREVIGSTDGSGDSIFGQLTLIKSDIKTLQEALSDVGDNTETRLTAAEGAIMSLNSSIKIVEDNTTYLQSLPGISNIVETHSSDITTMQDTINIQENTISTMSETISTLQTKIEALENLIASGTEDPESANLNENTKYYIKYED